MYDASLGKEVGYNLIIDQNFSQACQREFLKF